jgi:hypothetical protein
MLPASESGNEHGRIQGAMALLPYPVIAHRSVRHPVPGWTCQCSSQRTSKSLGILPQGQFQQHLSQEGGSIRLLCLQNVQPTQLLGQPLSVDGHEARLPGDSASVLGCHWRWVWRKGWAYGHQQSRLLLHVSWVQSPLLDFCRQFRLRWLALLHFQHTGYWFPWHSSGVGCPLLGGLAPTSHNLVGGLAATLAASSFRASLKSCCRSWAAIASPLGLLSRQQVHMQPPSGWSA